MQIRCAHKSALGPLVPFALLSLSAVLMTGCGASFVPILGTPGKAVHPAIQGTLHGGQLPVSGASIQLYAAGTGLGYGEGALPLLIDPLPQTDANGNFVITGEYLAPTTPSFFYIVATGGSPGVGMPVNPNISLMTTIGGCDPTVGVPASTSVEINEVTTAATAIAMNQYLAAPALLNNYSPIIGAPSSDTTGLQNAFQAVNNLVNTGSGIVVPPTSNYFATADNGLLLNSFGNILASCVNSDPLLNNACAELFLDAKPGTLAYQAVETMQASYYMAQNPTNNVAELFALITNKAPFTGYVTAPAAFTTPLANVHSSCPATINLGTADQFELLASSTITASVGGTVTGGNMGLYPDGPTSVTGFGPGGATLVGTMYLGDETADKAQMDLGAAATQIASLPGGALLPADISGNIFPPGLYKSASTLAFTSDITLDAQGDSAAQFVFQIASSLTTSASVHLINGAQAKNIFWQVGSSATLGQDTTFEGTILAYSSISINTKDAIVGRALASNGAVTLTGPGITVTAP